MSLATPEQVLMQVTARKQQLDIVRVIETAAASRVAGVAGVAAPLLNIITDLDNSNSNNNTSSSRVSKREHQRPGSNVTDTGTATSKTSGMGPGTSSEVSCDAPTPTYTWYHTWLRAAATCGIEIELFIVTPRAECGVTAVQVSTKFSSVFPEYC